MSRQCVVFVIHRIALNMMSVTTGILFAAVENPWVVDLFLGDNIVMLLIVEYLLKDKRNDTTCFEIAPMITAIKDAFDGYFFEVECRS
ncbi:hypothetical protein WN944_028182 [Citrus x changshan-huyou]|uniref:Uncharacterized protein n=1 Tax=Citrus x changshan-huyou TaxID=2935761 RepID=A0AAP0LNA5_9ROSI